MSGRAPVSTPRGSAVDIGPVAPVVVRVVGIVAVVERRARDVELALVLAFIAFGGVFFTRLIP